MRVVFFKKEVEQIFPRSHACPSSSSHAVRWTARARIRDRVKHYRAGVQAVFFRSFFPSLSFSLSIETFLENADE